MHIINKILFSLFLLSLPFASFAADVDTTEDDIRQIITAEKISNDDFHTILSEMWGGFVFSDGSGDPTLLSEVVGYTNVLALVLGIIIVSYVAIAAIINSAQSGEVLGRQWSTYWLPIRTAFAFGLLVPTEVGGFALSTAQVMVLKLVIMASTSASFLWENAVNTTLTMNNSSPSVVLPYKLAYESSVALACAYGMAQERTLGDPPVVKLNYTDGSTKEILESKAENISTLASSLAAIRTDVLSQSYDNLQFIEEIEFLGGDCGKISFSIPDFEKSGYAAFTQAQEVAESAISSDELAAGDLSNYTTDEIVLDAIDNLSQYQGEYILFLKNFTENVLDNDEKTAAPDGSTRARVKYNDRYQTNPMSFEYADVANEYYLKIKKGNDAFSLYTDVGQSSYVMKTSTKVLARLYNYKNAVNVFVSSVEDLYDTPVADITTDTQERVLASLTKGGWLYAGSFFYKISQLESLVHTTSSAMISGSSNSTLASCTQCNENEDITASTEFISALYRYSFLTPVDIDSSIGVADGVTPLPSEAVSVPLISTININDSVSEATINGAVSAWALKMLAELGTVTILSDGSIGGTDLGKLTDNNPFQFAANIGHGMNNLRYIVYMAKLSLTTYIFMSDAVVDSVNSSVAGKLGVGAPVGLAAAVGKAIATMLLEILTVGLTLLTAMSWTLAYYIPMMPALLWITLIGAYLLIVIEAVVATPLAVILMATPEGEGISGSKMQNAITLLASVYLRPSLMIIGLIAAIFVAKYSFIVLNIIFWSQAESAVRSDLFGFFATFSLYVISLHQVLSNSIKSIDSLPTAILNWVGQGANAQFGQNEISGASDQLGAKENTFGSVGDSFKSVFNQKIKNKKQGDLLEKIDQEKEKKS
jgi:conjugal transfer/type IV secretion protein DotA/TraY